MPLGYMLLFEYLSQGKSFEGHSKQLFVDAINLHGTFTAIASFPAFPKLYSTYVECPEDVSTVVAHMPILMYFQPYYSHLVTFLKIAREIVAHIKHVTSNITEA